MSEVHVSLLKARVKSFLFLARTISVKVKSDCELRGVPYHGKSSWSDARWGWYKIRCREIIAYAKSVGLCRKHIKEAVIEFEKERKEEKEK